MGSRQLFYTGLQYNQDLWSRNFAQGHCTPFIQRHFVGKVWAKGREDMALTRYSGGQIDHYKARLKIRYRFQNRCLSAIPFVKDLSFLQRWYDLIYCVLSKIRTCIVYCIASFLSTWGFCVHPWYVHKPYLNYSVLVTVIPRQQVLYTALVIQYHRCPTWHLP